MESSDGLNFIQGGRDVNLNDFNCNKQVDDNIDFEILYNFDLESFNDRPFAMESSSEEDGVCHFLEIELNQGTNAERKGNKIERSIVFVSKKGGKLHIVKEEGDCQSLDEDWVKKLIFHVTGKDGQKRVIGVDREDVEVESISKDEYVKIYNAVFKPFLDIARDSKKVDKQKESSSSTLSSRTVTYVDQSDRNPEKKVNGKKVQYEQQRVQFHENIHKEEKRQDEQIADSVAARKENSRKKDRQIRAKLIYVGKQKVLKWEREHDEVKVDYYE